MDYNKIKCYGIEKFFLYVMFIGFVIIMVVFIFCVLDFGILVDILDIIDWFFIIFFFNYCLG